ncbi:MAG: type II secretion system F family protein [Alphaproteobacteria bacterium]
MLGLGAYDDGAAKDSFSVKLARFLFKSDAAGRVRVYRKLAQLQRTGVPLPRAIESLWNLASQDGKKTSDPKAIVFEQWLKRVANGDTLGDALTGWVPDKERMLIEAAGSARLEMALENAAALVIASKEMSGAIVGGIAYPIFLLVAIGAVLYIFGVKVIPVFATVKPMSKWTGTAASLSLISSFVQDYAVYTAMALVGLAVLSVWSMPRWTGKIRAKFDGSPPYSFYRLFMGAGFLMSVSSLVRAGMPVPEGLRKLLMGASPWFEERINSILYHINEGHQLGDAMAMTGYDFPDRDIIQDLRLYASLGNFDEKLQMIAEEWIAEGIKKIKAQAGVINMMGMIIIGILVAWLGAGIMDLQGQITKDF